MVDVDVVAEAARVVVVEVTIPVGDGVDRGAPAGREVDAHVHARAAVAGSGALAEARADRHGVGERPADRPVRVAERVAVVAGAVLQAQHLGPRGDRVLVASGRGLRRRSSRRPCSGCPAAAAPGRRPSSEPRAVAAPLLKALAGTDMPTASAPAKIMALTERMREPMLRARLEPRAGREAPSSRPRRGHPWAACARPCCATSRWHGCGGRPSRTAACARVRAARDASRPARQRSGRGRAAEGSRRRDLRGAEPACRSPTGCRNRGVRERWVSFVGAGSGRVGIGHGLGGLVGAVEAHGDICQRPVMMLLDVIADER